MGRSGILGSSWPPLSHVVSTMVSPAYRSLLLTALRITLTEAAIGYAIGIAIAIVLALGAHLVRALRAGLIRLAAIVNTIPILVLGPLFLATLPRSEAPIALAAVSVLFTVVVAVSSGLVSYQAAHADLFSVLGASRPARLIHLDLPASLPMFADGLKIAAPVALLGAIIGEWFGADSGLGPLLVSAMQNYQVDLLWSVAVVAALASAAAYGGLSLVQASVSERFR